MPVRSASARVPNSKASFPFRWGWGKFFSAGIVFILAAIAIFAAILVLRRPFSEAEIVRQLEQAGSGKVEIQKFHETYFPHPGCVAEGITYRLALNAPPFANIERLRIQGNIIGLMAHHIRLVRADGVHVYVPSMGAKDKFSGLSSGKTHVDEIDVHDALLEVPQKQPGKTAAKFTIHELRLTPVSTDQPIRFSARLAIPEPPGEIRGSGQFGPWRGLQTPVSGDYSFSNADLGGFEGIAGTLSAEGKFGGALQHIDVTGKVSIPDFEVKRSEHKISLSSEFTAYVDGANGDTYFSQVASHFSKTTVQSKGKVAGIPGHTGKTAAVDLESRNGRIEDILRLFSKAQRPPMRGDVSFKGKAILPPGQVRFLKRVEMAGDFGISDSNFTSPTTQKKVDELSQSAQTETKEKSSKKKEEKESEAAPPVVSELKGHVELRNGTAIFTNLSFYIPGAHAQMHGTYNLIDEKIDLHGSLRMDSELSDTAHGAKALMLKVLDPFFKKKHGGSEVPVKVSGSYHEPSFGLDVGGAGKKVVTGKRILLVPK